MKEDDLFVEVIQRKDLYKGIYIQLQSLKIRLPDGREGVREIARVPDAVAVLPLDSKENAHLVRQHRPAIGKTLIEIPAGLIDKGETPEHAAFRECEEETGNIPDKLIPLLTYAHAEGYSTGFISLFIGSNSKATGQVKLDRTEFLEPFVVPFSELEKMVKRNEIVDSKTILTTLMWSNLRRNPKWLDS